MCFNVVIIVRLDEIWLPFLIWISDKNIDSSGLKIKIDMKNHNYFFIKILLLAGCFSALILPVSHAQIIQNVKEINTGSSGSSYPTDFTIANNKLFFVAAGNSGTYGLWVTEGTGATTQMLSPATGPLNNIPDIISYHNKIYFSYNDGINGNELWVSDGTATGTVLFKDLYFGSTGSFPQAFTVANDKLFFMGNNADGERRLYVSDGTVSGTFVIKNNYINLFNGLADFAVLNTDIYFTSDNGTGFGYGLWKSDGTLGGTVLVMPDLQSTTGGNYAVLNNKLYFSGFDYTNGSELWVTDGTSVGTHIVINLSADAGGILYSGAPNNLLVFKDKIYFTGKDALHGVELFVTDGTAAGTQLVKDMVPGVSGSQPSKSIVYNGLLYFSCLEGVAAGLWKSDGTSAGTVLVKSGGGADPWLNDLRFAAVWDNKLYFILGSNPFYLMWQTDGTAGGTKPIQLQNTVNPVGSFNDGFKFAEYNAELYFSGSCNTITSGYELCKLTSGTVSVPLLSSQASAVSVYPNPAKDKLYINGFNSIKVVSISDVSGNIISHADIIAGTRSINISQLPKGIYFLSLKTNDTIQTLKFIKE